RLMRVLYDRSGTVATETAARPPGRSTRWNSARPHRGSGKNISPRLHTTASKLPSKNESACPSSTAIDAFFAWRRRARPFDHCRRDVGGSDVPCRTDDTKGRFGKKPCGRGNVQATHFLRDVSSAAQ